MDPLTNREASGGSSDVSVRGVAWTGMASGITTVLQFSLLTVLARLLTPEDFGLYGIVLIVVGFAQVFADAGLSSALIQRREPTQEQLSSLYWLNVLAGAAIAALLAISAPIVAVSAGESALNYLLPLSCLAFLFSAFGQQYLAIAEKGLQFKRIAFIEVIAAVVAIATSVGLALLNFGAYALVIGQILSAAIRSLLLIASGIGAFRPSLRLKRDDVRGYVSFGVVNTLDRGLGYFTARIDQLVVATFLGVAELGLYVVATNITVMLVYRLRSVFTRVAFPVLAQVQADSRRLVQEYFGVSRLLGIVFAPLLLGMIVAAPEIITVAMGPEWLPATDLVRILAVLGLLKAVQPIGSLMLARGKPQWLLNITLMEAGLTIPLTILGASLAGAEGVACAMIVVELSRHLIGVVILPKLIEASRIGFLWQIALPTALAIAMMAIVFVVSLATERHGLGTLALEVGVGGATYIIALRAFMPTDFDRLLGLLRPHTR